MRWLPIPRPTYDLEEVGAADPERQEYRNDEGEQFLHVFSAGEAVIDRWYKGVPHDEPIDWTRFACPLGGKHKPDPQVVEHGQMPATGGGVHYQFCSKCNQTDVDIIAQLEDGELKQILFDDEDVTLYAVTRDINHVAAEMHAFPEHQASMIALAAQFRVSFPGNPPALRDLGDGIRALRHELYRDITATEIQSSFARNGQQMEIDRGSDSVEIDQAEVKSPTAEEQAVLKFLDQLARRILNAAPGSS
jgi:hypothetical protein